MITSRPARLGPGSRPMRVLLIGANGYLGRFVADRLLADPAVQLTALGRGDDADVRFDLASGSPGALTRFLDAVHPGVVVNCAGATRGGARDLTRHNTVAVATVCEALRRSGCGARLVQIGCGAEYGPQPARLLHRRGRRPPPRRPVRRQQARRHRTGPRLRPGRGRPARLLAGRPRHPRRLPARPARRGHAPRHAVRRRRAQARRPRRPARLRRRTRRGPRRARRLALRRAGRHQHRLGPRRPAARRRRRPRPRRRVRRRAPRTRRPARPAAGVHRPPPLRIGPRGARPRTRTRTAAAAGSRPTCAPHATGSAGGPGSTWRSPSPTSGWRRHAASDQHRRQARRAPTCAPASASPVTRTRWSPPPNGPNSPARAPPCTGSSSTSPTAPAPAPTRTAWRRPAGCATRASASSATSTPAYGARAFGELISDAHRYLDWYRVDGFFLDRCPTERAALPEVRRTVTDAPRAPRRRPHRPRPRHPPVPRIRRDRRPVGHLLRPLERLPLVAGGRVDRRLPARALLPPRPRRARARTSTRRCASPAGRAPATIYFTDRTDAAAAPTPGRRMPGYWDEIVSRIGTGVSE